jgi:hypothetical protein
MRALLLADGLLLDLIRYLGILDNSIELRDNFIYYLFGPHGWLLVDDLAPFFQFRVNIYLLYIILEEYNLHLPLFHILQAIQYLEA